MCGFFVYRNFAAKYVIYHNDMENKEYYGGVVIKNIY